MMQEATTLLPFYVYELRDPRTGQVFYVGKGTELRIEAHVGRGESSKEKRIEEIEREGLKVRRVIVARFETAVEAFAVESVLIKWVYGFHNLCNKVHGHRERFVRGFEQKDPVHHTDLPGIDIERKIRGLNDGAFTAAQRSQILRHGIVEKLETLRDTLRQSPEVAGLAFSDVDLHRADNPCIWVTGFSDVVRMVASMQLSGDRIRLGLVAMNPRDGSPYISALTQIAEPYKIKNEASSGRYTHTADFVSKSGGFPGGIPHEAVDDIARHIVSAIERMKKKV